MKTLGLIVEYNPFHKGHAYHLQKAIEKTAATHTLAVMSGPFVQRGEAALVDPWRRTGMALSMGLDLVIELPPRYCLSGADDFARGAVMLLTMLGLVEDVVFGSESGDFEALDKVAALLAREDVAYKKALKTHLDQGVGFARASHQALFDLTGSKALQWPNDTLGLAYLVAAKKMGSPLSFHTIKRRGASYHDEEITNEFASATAIRQQIKKGMTFEHLVPPPTLPFYEGNLPFPQMSDLYPFYRLLALRSPESLSQIHEVSEGLDKRMVHGARRYQHVEDFLSYVGTKRYTQGRIRRILIKSLLGLTKESASLIPTVARVYGFSEKGKALLSKAKETSQIPLLTSLDHQTLDRHPDLLMSLRASDLYGLVTGSWSMGEDFRRPPLKP